MSSLLEKIEQSAATRLALPENRKPSEELGRFKTFLKVETHRLKILHRGGGSGREVCRARTAIFDVLLRYILDGAKKSIPDTEKIPEFALVALGGFGRMELNPCSDIDVMFLHDGGMVSRGKPVPSLTALNEAMLYTLWDIGVKVGHSVRSIDECVKLANQDMQSKTSMIEARLIAGSQSLFEQFQKTIIARCVSGHEDEYVQERLQDQAARRAKFGNSPLLQEPNIKNGCGGLRDFQNLIWMTFFKYQTRSLKELEQKEMISPAERKQLEAAYDFLLRTRNDLHYHVGRPVDVLTKSVQPAIAHNLGYTDRSPSLRLEKFMRDYYIHTRNIDLITRTLEQRLALVPRKTLLPSFKRLLDSQRARIRSQIVDGFKFLDGEILPSTSYIFRDRPWRMMRVFLYAQQRNLKLHPDMTQMIRNHLHLVNNSFLRDPHVRKTFLEILNQRGNVAPVLRQMHEVGLLGKFLPEFGKLTCLVQHEFYHQYTADEHTLVCIEKLDQVWAGKEAPFTSYTSLFQGIEKPSILYLALLLHDAGKAYSGKGKRHEEIGRKLARKAARRLGLDSSTTDTLSLLIENHLTMAVVSQRRDLDDPAVIRHFAGIIQNTENLAMLTLHTFADSLGTSDQLWNGFKDSLLQMLYIKTREVLVGGTTMIRAEAKQRELLAEEVRSLMPKSISEEELEAHFDNLPARYFQINSAREIALDLTLVHRFIKRQLSEKEEALSPVISWQNEPDRGYTVVTVCTWDREALFSHITGSLSAAGFNILSAEIMTRSDGMVLDTFFVTDTQTGLLARRDEKEAFEKLLDKILLGGEVDLKSAIAKRKRSSTMYKSLEGEKIATVVTFDNETSETQTVIDVESEDSIGLLYTISEVLTELGLNVSLAKIVTEKGAAIDSFYVTDIHGNKVTDPDYLKQIERKLRKAIDRLGK